MVIYDLQCLFGHRFEGWFPNADAFDKQRAEGLVACSECGSLDIKKVVSGGHIAKHAGASKKRVVKHADALVSAPSHDSMNVNFDPVTVVKAMTQYIKNNCKNVSDKFAETAIKMHKGEAPHEAIYGSATEDDYQKMEDEGVPYAVVPKLGEEFEN
ncbi:DUF1178 family protein [bacterium]|nr:DUF1178 family protein [bacterium]